MGFNRPTMESERKAKADAIRAAGAQMLEMISSDDKRLLARVRRECNDLARMAKVIDTAKRQRREKDPGWRKRLSPRERTVWRLINVLRETGRVEALIGRTEDSLGLRRSRSSQSWEGRLRRIYARRPRSD
jgi:hypothetical protein